MAARRAQRNPLLAIIGNPPVIGRSEREVWGHLLKLAKRLQSPNVTVHFSREAGAVIERMANDMLGQLYQGVHVNPGRIRERVKLSGHVQAIAYVHQKDGGRYVHGFGNCDPDEDDLKNGILDLDALKTTTHVAMYAEPDGSISIVGTKGQPLAALFR